MELWGFGGTIFRRRNGISPLQRRGKVRLKCVLKCVKCGSVNGQAIPEKINTTIASAVSELV